MRSGAMTGLNDSEIVYEYRYFVVTVRAKARFYAEASGAEAFLVRVVRR